MATAAAVTSVVLGERRALTMMDKVLEATPSSSSLVRAESITTLPPTITLLPRPSSTDIGRRPNCELHAQTPPSNSQEKTNSTYCFSELSNPKIPERQNPKSSISRTPGMFHSSSKDKEVLNSVLNRMDAMQEELRDGIEAMQLWMDELQSYQSSETQNTSTKDTSHQQDLDQEDRISQESCLVDQKVLSFSSEGSEVLKAVESRVPPLPTLSAFQLTRGGDLSSDDEESMWPMDFTAAPHVQVSARNGLKTGVVLNLNSKNQFSKTPTIQTTQTLTKNKLQPQCRALGKLLSLLCIKKGLQSTRSGLSKTTQDCCSQISSLKPSRVFETAKVLTRSCRKSTAFSLAKHRRNSRLGISSKHAEKDSMNLTTQSSISPLSQRFCTETKSPNIVLNSSSKIATLRKSKSASGCVFSADGIQSGTAQFDITVSSLTGKCFVGIIPNLHSRSAARGNEGSFNLGWPNASEIFSETRHRLIKESRRRSSRTTNFQVIVDTLSGTVKMRVRQKSAKTLNSNEDSKFTEYELHFDTSAPKDWHLGIQWTGKGEFRLNNVEIWQ